MSQQQPKEKLRPRVALVLDDFTLVITKGADAGLKLGQRVQVYAVGMEIRDPETRESLGMVEIVRGTGRIRHLQEKIATVTSDMREAPTRRIHERPSLIATYLDPKIEEIEPGRQLPFESPAAGDFVRFV